MCAVPSAPRGSRCLSSGLTVNSYQGTRRPKGGPGAAGPLHVAYAHIAVDTTGTGNFVTQLVTGNSGTTFFSAIVADRIQNSITLFVRASFAGVDRRL